MNVCASSIPVPTDWCSRMSTSILRRARWSQSLATMARARRRSSSCFAGCISRQAAGSRSTAASLARWRPTHGGCGSLAQFQDFFRFELKARETIGVGDVERIDDRPAIAAAVERGGAGDVIAQLAAGLETQLGPTWPQGVDLSFGQWQKLALARGFMRKRPLVLLLDEPTAALDAETEHALFERFATAARNRGGNGRGNGAPDGRITILVSHRFSTVRMADFIVVLDGVRVVESGSHDELMAKGGHYAELYAIQAAAYR